MSKQRKKFFISTAIDYVNAPAHCGHALEKVQADVIARHHRILGEDVLFLTGTDENSLKNVRAAEKERIPVKKLVDRNAKKFYDLKNALNLSFDDFIRTTEERHIKGAQMLWLDCQKDIYKKKYKGLYCVGCEEFYKESELVEGCCPEHKTKPELVEEENYFFHLSKYQGQIEKIIESDKVKIIPTARKNEILSFIDSELHDICISRSAERAKGWGIDVPGDPTQKIWCWLEALSNYITALGYGENSKRFQEFWQENENKIHVIGKGIIRFHAVYWIGILLSAGLSLPKTIFVHGYLTSGGQKMSKSLGNVVDPFELVRKYGTDPVRYFLLREFSSTEDGDFSYEKFEERYIADLQNGIGNLLSRATKLAEIHWNGIVPEIALNKTGLTADNIHFITDFSSRRPKFFKEQIEQKYKVSLSFMKKFQFNGVLLSINNLVKQCDAYIESFKLYNPAEVLGSNEEKLNIVLFDVLEAIRHIGVMLVPFLPQTSRKIFEQLGLPGYVDKISKGEIGFEQAKQWGGLPIGAEIKKGEPLFPRL